MHTTLEPDVQKTTWTLGGPLVVVLVYLATPSTLTIPGQIQIVSFKN